MTIYVEWFLLVIDGLAQIMVETNLKYTRYNKVAWEKAPRPVEIARSTILIRSTILFLLQNIFVHVGTHMYKPSILAIAGRYKSGLYISNRKSVKHEALLEAPKTLGRCIATHFPYSFGECYSCQHLMVIIILFTWMVWSWKTKFHISSLNV